jgi:hypothetical protein
MIELLRASCVSPVGVCNDTSSTDLTIPVILGALVLLAAGLLVVVAVVRVTRRR